MDGYNLPFSKEFFARRGEVLKRWLEQLLGQICPL